MTDHPIVLGTALFGTAIPPGDALRLMDAFAEAGGTWIDTAPIYGAWVDGGHGASERIVGEWLAANRGSAVRVATKAGHPPLDRMEEADLSEMAIRRDVVESLERLGVGCIDLLWLHRDEPQRPAAEIIAALDALRRDGLIGQHGASNWPADRLAEAAEAAAEQGVAGFAASQVGFSLARFPSEGPLPGMRAMDAPAYAFHLRTGLPVWGYCAQASGFFRSSEPAVPTGKEALGPVWTLPENQRRRAEAQRIAARRGVPATRVALAWMLARPFPVRPIIGPRTIEQLRDSLAAVHLRLDEDERRSLAPDW